MRFDEARAGRSYSEKVAVDGAATYIANNGHYHIVMIGVVSNEK